MPRIKYDKAEVLADWKTGKFTERDIASKHRISPTTAHNIVKGVDKTIGVLVSKQIKINQELTECSAQEVSKFKQEVDEQTKHIQYFNKRAIENVDAAFVLPVENQNDCKARAETISKARENVLGRAPDTAININASGKTQVISAAMSAQDAARAYADFMATG